MEALEITWQQRRTKNIRFLVAQSYIDICNEVAAAEQEAASRQDWLQWGEDAFGWSEALLDQMVNVSLAVLDMDEITILEYGNLNSTVQRLLAAPQVEGVREVVIHQIAGQVGLTVERTREIVQKAIVKETKQTERVERWEARKQELITQAKQMVIPDRMQLLCGDFRDVGNQIADESVDLIFTDPPYDTEGMAVWNEFGQFAARVLKPGASLLCYAGKAHMLQELQALFEWLTPRWIFALALDEQSLVPHEMLYSKWRPILWFSKGRSVEHVYCSDFFQHKDRPDKELYAWAQGEEAAMYYIEKFTLEKQLVVDPFMGTGSFVRAAHQLGRQVIGIEWNEERFEIAKGGIHQDARRPA